MLVRRLASAGGAKAFSRAFLVAEVSLSGLQVRKSKKILAFCARGDTKTFMRRLCRLLS